MKKLILFAAILFAGVSMVKAEKPGDKDLNVNLTVTLNSIQSITIETGQNNVDLVYTTDDDYKTGVNSPNENHIEVFSTNKGFKVFAKSAGFTRTGGGDAIKTSSITLVSTAGTKAIDGATYTGEKGVKLAATGTGVEIFDSNEKQGKHNQISVEYKGLDNYGYLDFLNDDGTPAVYTAEVLYTIIAQ